MADDTEGADPLNEKNPYFEAVLSDIQNQSKWARIDAQILRRRLCERKKKRTKPYVGAPNTRVPIVDDTVRDKTDQEVTMIANAPLLAHIVPLEPIDAMLRQQAQLAFDTYLRHMIVAIPKIEEALDTKNARGLAVIKVLRTQHERFGELPTFDTRDPRQVIVPAETKDIQQAIRITEAIIYSKTKFKRMAKRRGWKKELVDKILKLATEEGRESSSESDVSDAFQETMHLVGLTSAGEGSENVILWEHWHYATDWDRKKAGANRLAAGEKCVTIFSPQLPNEPLECRPWRERDEWKAYQTREEIEAELMAAQKEQRNLRRGELVKGRPRPWPYIVARYENRSKFHYDTRGAGQLCMDDQIVASAEQNAKLTLIDFYQLPQYTGEGTRNSTNISHEPGSYIPGNVKRVDPPDVSQQFDWDVERHKRAAARRCGAGQQYQFSGDLSAKKRVQKTAREVEEESTHGQMISSASVDRFNSPWREVFQQLWDDLRRMERPLPMIENNTFIGMAPAEIYKLNVLLVPAANAKTYNPDQQFVRARAAWDWAVQALLPLGVVLDPEAAAQDILGSWDPLMTSRWVKPAGQEGAQGQVPVYAQLQQLAQMMQQLGQALTQNSEMDKKLATTVEHLAALAEQNQVRLNALAGGGRETA